MIAWILSSSRLPYLAGVFHGPEAAARYLAEIPAGVRNRSAIASRADLALPCYLVEDASGFRPLSEPEAQAYLTGLAQRRPGANGVYGTLYRLDGEFRPQVPGRDEMGRLPHVHLQARDLALVARAGVAALRRDLSDAASPGV